MNFINIIYQTSPNIIEIYRKIEKNSTKILKQKWSIIFNKTNIGIKGNKKADEAVKQALDMPGLITAKIS